MKIAHYFSLIIFLRICLLFSCAEKPVNDKAIIVFSIGKVTITKGKNTIPASIKATINKDDIIKTGDNSFLTLQVGETAIVKVNPNTKVAMRSLLNKEEESLYLEQGKVLSKVKKLSKDSGFIIKTPTAIAAVRGTEFSVNYEYGESTTAVKKGKVLVKTTTSMPEKEKEEILVETGKAGVTKEKIEMRSITKLEELEMEKVSKASYVDEIMTNNTDAVEKIGTEQNKLDEEINEKIKNLKLNQPMSLEEIKKEFKRIDIVSLYNGKVIKGIILSRGRFYKMNTPEGPMTIDSKQIKTTMARY